MNLKLLCFLVVCVQVLEVKSDCDDYFKCIGDIIKDFFGAKDMNEGDVNQNASDFKSEEKFEIARNTSISVYEIAADLQKGLAKILNDATSLIKDNIERHYKIDSEAGPYQTKNDKTEINIRIFNISKPLNSKSTNAPRAEIVTATNYFTSTDNIIAKSSNISSSITFKLFEELSEQQRHFFDSFMHLNNTNNNTYFNITSIESEPNAYNHFDKEGFSNFSGLSSRVYLPDTEVNNFFREFISDQDNDDVLIDLPKIESNHSFVIEDLNDTKSQDFSQFNDLVSELIKINKNNEVTNERRHHETYDNIDNASRNDNISNLKINNISSSVKVDIEKANVVILEPDNKENDFKEPGISNNTFQKRKYLSVKSEQVIGVKNTSERKEERKYLPTKTTSSLNKTNEKHVEMNNNNNNNLRRNLLNNLNSTSRNSNKMQVTKEDTMTKDMKGINENRKYLSINTNFSQKIISEKAQLVTDKKGNNSNGDSKKLSESLQRRKYLPINPNQETKMKQNKTNITKTTKNAVLETNTVVNNSNDKPKTMKGDSQSNKYLPTISESKIKKNSTVIPTEDKNNTIIKGSPTNDSNRLKNNIMKLMNNSNRQEPSSNDAIEENEVLGDDFDVYSNYDDEENSTDYPVIDYIELYKDTTNEKVEYVSTTPAPPDFRSDTVDNNKEGERNGLDGASLSETVFPWIATIFVKNGSNQQFDYYCDGAILSRNTVLTSGRCVSAAKSSRPEDFITIVGKRSLQSTRVDETVHRVKQIIIHDGFTTSVNETRNDLAILVLEDDLVFNNGTRATCIFDSDEEPLDTFTTGWDYSGNLTVIRLHKDQNCKEIPQNTFCTAFGNDVAVCPSHGGVHAMKQSDGRTCLTGVRASDTTARGVCIDRNVIYTNIKVFKEWIERILNDNKDF